MHSLRDEITQSFRTAPLFALAVLLTLGVTGIIGLMVFLMVVLKHGFLGITHGTDPSHRVHDLTFGFLFGVTVMGLLAQLRRPWANVAGMLMALIPWGGLLLAGILSADVYRVMVINPSRLVAPATVITALLHPTGRAFFRSFSVSRVNWVMLALVIIASVPLLAFTIVNIRLQRTVPDDHAAMGHYGFMAAFGFTVIGVSLLASLRPDGWRLTAWVAGILPTLLGLISLAYPGNASSLSRAWALAAIAWGILFIVVAELTQAVRSPKYLRSELKGGAGMEPDREPATGTPHRVNLFGVILLILLLLFMIMMLIGGGHGPGRHLPFGDSGGYPWPLL